MTTSKADDAKILSLPEDEKFALLLTGSDHQQGQFTRFAMLSTRHGSIPIEGSIMIIFNIRDAVISGQNVRIAHVDIADVEGVQAQH